ncbi:MAG: hypothetical protein ER33_08275 [Cyanobium sp. CACIAM 14]|nr:MAG: hypothetical protein ER33_08275 [Cyanobium sp. CACIAM 14]
MLRGLGLAATGGLLIGAPAMAGIRAPGERSEPLASPAAVESVATLPAQPDQGALEPRVAMAPSSEPQLSPSEPQPTGSASAPSVAVTPAPIEVAQTYPQPAVKEGYSAKGWYLTIGAGAQTPSDQTVNSTSPLINPFLTPILFNFSNNNSTKLNLGGGFSGDVGIGYDFGALRTELTYGYSRASLNAVGAANPIGFGLLGVVPFTNNVSGVINKNDVLLSVYYDFENNSRWTPYIGGGIGYSNLSTPSFALNGVPTNSVNKGLFGWQAKAGISYAMSYNTDLYLEGVYQGTGGYSTENLRFDSFNSWGGKVGFRYRFGSHAAAPAPKPEPVPTVEPSPAPIPMPQPEPAPAPIRGLW